nr:hypothetical protein [Tanacetum cinerariifolium]
IKDGGLMMDGAKIKAIQDWEPPTKVTELRSFVGLEGLEHDPLARKIIALAKDGRTRRFWLKGDMLFTKGDRLYVPKWGDLRREILKECHDSKWDGHPGITRTQDIAKEVGRIARAFTDAQVAMGECFHRLYHMLAKVERRWKYYSGGGLILECLGSEIHGELLDGVNQDHVDGFELLHEFSSLNGREIEKGECTIGDLSSSLYHGRQPLTPNALAASYEGSSLAAYKTMKEWHEQADLTCASLDKAAKKMKKWADEKRRYVEFEFEDQVMVKLLPQQFKSLRKVHKGLIQSFLKPYHEDEEDTEREVSKRVPTAVVTSYDRDVEEIMSDCTIQRRRVTSYKKYLIKWCDLPDSEAS